MMWILLTKPMQKSVTTVCLHCSFASLKNKHIGVLGTNVATISWRHWSPVSGYSGTGTAHIRLHFREAEMQPPLCSTVCGDTQFSVHFPQAGTGTAIITNLCLRECNVLSCISVSESVGSGLNSRKGEWNFLCASLLAGTVDRNKISACRDVIFWLHFRMRNCLFWIIFPQGVAKGGGMKIFICIFAPRDHERKLSRNLRTREGNILIVFPQAVVSVNWIVFPWGGNLEISLCLIFLNYF